MRLTQSRFRSFGQSHLVAIVSGDGSTAETKIEWISFTIDIERFGKAATQVRDQRFAAIEAVGFECDFEQGARGGGQPDTGGNRHDVLCDIAEQRIRPRQSDMATKRLEVIEFAQYHYAPGPARHGQSRCIARLVPFRVETVCAGGICRRHRAHRALALNAAALRYHMPFAGSAFCISGAHERQAKDAR